MKYMRLIIYTGILLAIINTVQAQTSEVLRSSRPGQSFTPYTVGKNVFQIQSGLDINGFDDDGVIDGSGVFFVLLGRYGITETIEVRTDFQLNNDRITSPDGKERTNGLSAWNIGMRFNILNPDNAKSPALGFQFDLNLNASGEDYKSEYIAPKLLLLHSQNLSNRLGLTTNWGVGWNGNSASPRGLYTLAFTYAIGTKWALLLENYGEVENGDYDTRFDTGIGYLLNNDVQLDVGAGYGHNDGIRDYFAEIGASIRF